VKEFAALFAMAHGSDPESPLRGYERTPALPLKPARERQLAIPEGPLIPLRSVKWQNHRMQMLPERQIVEEFRARRKRQLIVLLPALLVFIAIRAAEQPSAYLGISTTTVVLTGLAILTGFAIFSWRNWRCPSCDRYLGRWINPASCSKCGARLRA
jgi:hypothetical protein